jgi:hypothetical protein
LTVPYEEVRFALDSPLEQAGFEPSVPRKTPGILATLALYRGLNFLGFLPVLVRFYLRRGAGLP